MLFFDDKLLLKYSGVTGDLLAYDRSVADSFTTEAALNDALDTAKDALDAAGKIAETIKGARNQADLPSVLDATFAKADATLKTVTAKTDAAIKADVDAQTACAAAEARAKLFKPFESKTDTALSALSIISAPICLTLLALDEILSFIVSSLNFIATRFTLGPDAAKELGTEAVNHLLKAFKALLAAVVSPVVNTVDFVGSCVTTVNEGNGGEGHLVTGENDGSGYPMNP
jgi:hypothetical protein